ncbi:hypothetical protein [Ectopseudomonas composti]|uniref:hypothetical protein n=1 Tax=Ectopseudomonas composti TaxID=658457 RepID=UPI000A797830|nr:hypothetical protein [Pseudomonas composti]
MLRQRGEEGVQGSLNRAQAEADNGGNQVGGRGTKVYSPMMVIVPRWRERYPLGVTTL